MGTGDLRTAVRARLGERGSPSGGRTEAAADAAQVDCAARRQQGAHAARVADHDRHPRHGRPPGRSARRAAGRRCCGRSAARRARGRTASGCAGRRARAPRRGGSRRRRARTARPGRVVCSCCSRALVARHGPQNAVENWTTVRSASAGSTPSRANTGSCGATSASASPGRGPRRSASRSHHAATAGDHQRGDQHGRSDPAHPRQQPDPPRSAIPVSRRARCPRRGHATSTPSVGRA